MENQVSCLRSYELIPCTMLLQNDFKIFLIKLAGSIVYESLVHHMQDLSFGYGKSFDSEVRGLAAKVRNTTFVSWLRYTSEVIFFQKFFIS